MPGEVLMTSEWSASAEATAPRFPDSLGNLGRIRMALAHKDLEVETIPWRFTEKDAIAPHNSEKVPVLIDGEVGDLVRLAVAVAGETAERLADRAHDRRRQRATDDAAYVVGLEDFGR